MAQIYRKSLLERMASPEQLDRTVRVTSPMFWIALVGGGITVAAVLVWAIFGSLPVKVEASGVYVPVQGTYVITPSISGTVEEVELQPGDRVERDGVILRLKDETMTGYVDNVIASISVEAVTLTSTDDPVTEHSQPLITIKRQLAAAGLPQDQKQATLDQYKRELEAMEPELAAAEKAMNDAFNAYNRASFATDASKELDLNAAAQAQAQAQTARESAAVQLTSYEAACTQAMEALLAAARTAADSAIAQLTAQLEAAADETEAAALTTQLEQYTALRDRVAALDTSADPRQLDSEVRALLPGEQVSQAEELYTQRDSAKDALARAQSAETEAKKKYDAARQAYEEYSRSASSAATRKEQLSAKYSKLSGEYNALKSEAMSLEQTILSLEAQLAAGELEQQAQIKALEEEFETTKAVILEKLSKQETAQEEAMMRSYVVSPVEGIVSDVKVKQGETVGAGTTVAVVRKVDDDDEDIIQCYLPIVSGKKVAPGMRVIVHPATVSRQEYGHMEAEVVSVDEYISTPSAILDALGDETLAASFTQSGPVVGVTCRLRTDESTASGYWWSNKKGASVKLYYGTPMMVDIITEEKSPLSLLIPYLKEWLSGGGN